MPFTRRPRSIRTARATLAVSAAATLLAGCGSGGGGGSTPTPTPSATNGPLTTVVTFDGANGSSPVGIFLDPSGDLLGLDVLGTDLDNLYEIPAGTRNLQASHSNLSGLNSLLPSAFAYAFDHSNNLFIAFDSGGLAGQGVIYEVPANGSAPVLVATPAPSGAVSDPSDINIDANDNLFGASTSGGANGDGFLFEIQAGTTTVQDIADFNGTDGSSPVAVIVDAAGDLYGCTDAGGANGTGDVFKVAAGSPTIVDVADLGPTDIPDSEPWVDAQGDIFGITVNLAAGSPQADTYLFEAPAGTNTIKLLGAAFADTIQNDYVDPNGNVFLLFPPGFVAGNPGFIGELSAANPTVTTLFSLPSSTPTDANQVASFVLDSSDNIWLSASEYPDTQGILWYSSAASRSFVPHGRALAARSLSFHTPAWHAAIRARMTARLAGRR